MKRPQLSRIVKPLFGLALLAALLTQIDLDELLPLMRRGDPWLLAYSCLSFTASLCVFQALRLHVLVAHYTGGLRTSMRLFFVGAFFNNLLPSNVGGDAVRLLYLRRMKDGGWTAPLSLLLLHRLSGIAVMMAFFAGYAVIEGPRLPALLSRSGVMIEGPSALWIGAALGAAALMAPALVFARRTALGQRALARLRSMGATVRAALGELSRQSLLHLLWLTILFHGARMYGFYFAVRYFGQSIALWDLVPVLTFTAIMAMVPITVGGLGLVEGSVGVGLGLFGVSPSAAVATALINRLVMVVVALAGGVMYATDQGKLHTETPQTADS